tara:strand:- start:1014 stop:1229 length:216 start_codon:yes stop_codon:yes gene_type:complete
LAPWLNWIEQPPPKGQVRGSNPLGVATLIQLAGTKMSLKKILLTQQNNVSFISRSKVTFGVAGPTWTDNDR